MSQPAPATPSDGPLCCLCQLRVRARELGIICDECKLWVLGDDDSRILREMRNAGKGG